MYIKVLLKCGFVCHMVYMVIDLCCVNIVHLYTS
uniref:Uncharacterized protein n=1 Tax=Timema poppense TaxID=170557 RepID=A0A7R9DTU6_TIMPO|nr:unnamed protein product [Timema poppensis]